MTLNRKIWKKMSIADRIKVFMKAYKQRDPDLLYAISENIRYNRYHGEVIFTDNEIQHVINEKIELFAEKWVQNCDENLEPIIIYELPTDEDIEASIMSGKDFLISHGVKYDISSAEKLTDLYEERSIFTSEFGPHGNFKEIDVHDHFFTCTCGTSKGKSYLGMICPNCGQPVTERDFSVDKFGYFKSKYDVRFITPVGYALLSKILRSTNSKVGILDHIMGARVQPPSKRRKRKTISEKALARQEAKALEFSKLISRYKKRYLYESVEDLINEVLSTQKYNANKKLIEHFLKNKDKFFLKYIPVISTAFRKMSHTQTFGVDKFEAHNDLNGILIGMSQALQAFDMTYGHENQCWKYYNTVNKSIVKMFNSIYLLAGKGKGSYMRACVMGQRQNNVIMAVLEPLDRGLTEDICMISYRHLIALKNKDIEAYLLSKGIPSYIVHNMMNHNSVIQEDMKVHLRNFIKENIVVVEYNRQPTIRMQSSLALTVAGLTDYPVLFVHPSTAKKPNADHDKISVTFTPIRVRCNNTENCWKWLKPMSPAGSRKSEEKYIV